MTANEGGSVRGRPLRRLRSAFGGLAVVATAGVLFHAAAAAASVPGGGFSVRPAEFSRSETASRASFALTIPPGGARTRAVIVQNDGSSRLRLGVYPVAGLTAQTSGVVYANADTPPAQARRWLAPRVSEITVAAHSSLVVRFTLRVPGSAVAGDHLFGLAFQGGGTAASGADFRIREVIREVAGVLIRVPGVVSFGIHLGSPSIRTPVSGASTIIVPLVNSGGELCRPRLRVWFQPRGARGWQLERQLGPLLPGSHIDYPLPLSRRVEARDYNLRVSASCGAAQASATRLGPRRSSAGGSGPRAGADLPLWPTLLLVLLALGASAIATGTRARGRVRARSRLRRRAASAWLCGIVAAVLGLALVETLGAAGAIALVEKGTLATGSGTSITATLPAASTSGDLLVGVIEDTNGNCFSDTFSAPTGWVEATHTCRGSTGPIEVWYYPDAASGISSVVFNTGSSGANTLAQLSEWSGAATTSPLDQTGTSSTGSASTTLSVASSGVIGTTGELAVSGFLTSSGLSSYTEGSGWTNLTSDPGGGFDSDYELDPASGATLSDSPTSSPQTTWGGGLATFEPGGCSGGALSIESAPSVAFPGVTLNGYDATTTANVAFTLSDETGSASGWNLSATSTTLTSGSHTLPVTATTVTGASVSAARGNCSLPTNGVSYPVTLPAAVTAPTAVPLYRAAAGTGEGPSDVTLTAKIAVPANSYAGTYSSTWTVTISSGP